MEKRGLGDAVAPLAGIEVANTIAGFDTETLTDRITITTITATADDVPGRIRGRDTLLALPDEEVAAPTTPRDPGIVEVAHLDGALWIVGKTAAVISGILPVRKIHVIRKLSWLGDPRV
jgi:hypothetical protein